MKSTLLRPAALMMALVAAPAIADDKSPPSTAPTTHEVLTTITLKGEDTAATLQTLCVNANGEVVALVAPPRGYSAAQKNVSSEVHVLSADGKKIRHWKVDFHANSINVGEDGNVYIAGDGKVAKYDVQGRQLAQVALPHITELLKDTEGMKKKAEAQIKAQKESFARMIKTYTETKKKLEEKKDRTKVEDKQLEQYAQIIKSFDETRKYYDELTVESVVQQIISRLRVINAIAASKKDVFIVCGESEGYGFAVWRMDHQFGNVTQVMKNVIGCCGQMDVQCCGEDIYLAENTKHRFAKYDRDGKELGAWGKRETPAAKDGCFGGCCNPMNVRCCATGDVFTAESEGIIKRFSAKGEYLGVVAIQKLTGGCKNTAIASSADGEKIYLCDQPGSRVVIMGLRSGKKAE